jgi:acetyl esterase/lipase
MNYRLLLAVLLAASVPGPVRAADQAVLGRSFVVKDPSTPERRKVTAKAKEPATDATLVGNPVANGASVTITADGANPSTQTFALPAGTSPARGKPFWSGDATKGYTYSDPQGENGAVKKAQLKSKNGAFQIKVSVDGKRGPVVVVPPAPGTAGCVLLAITGGDSYSVAFATGEITNDSDVLFKVLKPTAQGSCVPTTTTSTSTTTTSSSTTTLPWPDVTPAGPAPLRYRDPVFTLVTVTPNIVYGSAVNASGQTVTLLLDLYQPSGDTITERPVIVWVHGGSFATGSKNSPELVDQANVFSMKGYVNASISYRLEPPGCSAGAPTSLCITAIQEAWQDAQTAVRFLRTNAPTYGIDENRIAIGGTSAGAITALNVGFTSSEDPTAAVLGAVSLSGAHIIGAIDGADAPSLLFHGTSDFVVPYQWAVNTRNAAVAVGLESYLTTWPGAGHVPYAQNRTQILSQTQNFLYVSMDLANAAQ